MVPRARARERFEIEASQGSASTFADAFRPRDATVEKGTNSELLHRRAAHSKKDAKEALSTPGGGTLHGRTSFVL